MRGDLGDQPGGPVGPAPQDRAALAYVAGLYAVRESGTSAAYEGRRRTSGSMRGDTGAQCEPGGGGEGGAAQQRASAEGEGFPSHGATLGTARERRVSGAVRGRTGEDEFGAS